MRRSQEEISAEITRRCQTYYERQRRKRRIIAGCIPPALCCAAVIGLLLIPRQEYTAAVQSHSRNPSSAAAHNLNPPDTEPQVSDSAPILNHISASVLVTDAATGQVVGTIPPELLEKLELCASSSREQTRQDSPDAGKTYLLTLPGEEKKSARCVTLTLWDGCAALDGVVLVDAEEILQAFLAALE